MSATVAASTDSMSEVSGAPRGSRRAERLRQMKVILGVGTGNAIEYFDWTVYATFAAFFSGQFFHTGSAVSDLLAGFAVFAVGFIARPFGGMVFGWIADRKGRKLSMTLAIGLAAVGSLVIGLTPTYGTIGVFASVVLVLARLAQGIAHGGELPSAQTYIVEFAPQDKRGKWSSIIYVSNTSGVILGTVLGVFLTSFLSHDAMTSWGWRVPFIIGGVLGLFVLWMRSRMEESQVYEEDESATEHDPNTKSMWQMFLDNRRQVLQILFFSVGGTIVYYVWGVSAPSYAITVRGIDPTGAFWAGLGANALLIVSLPLWGMLSDRIGRKPLMFGSLTAIAVLTIPLNALIGNSAWGLFIAMSIALVIFAANLAVMPAMMAELFPTGLRAAGVGVPYSISVAIFGGTAGYVQTFFADRGASDLFNWYMIAMVVVSLIALVTIPETRGRNLHEKATVPA